MKRNNLWRLTIVLVVLFWSLYEMYPPTPRNLIDTFAQKARAAAGPNDTTISNIVFQARELEKTGPDRNYANLLVAIGTNDITPYFPYDLKNEPNPTTYILNRVQREAAGRIKLGLDLQGGTSFLVEMDTTKLADTNEVSGALSQAVEVLRKRVDRFGVAEPVIQPAGDNRILIQLPGLSETDRARALTNIQKVAFLEFRLAHEQNDELVQANEVPPGYELLKRKERMRTGGERLEQVIVKRTGEKGLTGSIIKRAWVERGNLGEPEIHFVLNDEGTTRFGEVTADNRGRKLAIILDGELYSAPHINEPIPNGTGRITGGFDLRDALELASVLENPLRAPLHVLDSNDVDPTLGRDSVRSGIKASIYGVIAVAIFMLVYYMLAGVVANAALCLNIVILLGVMCSIGTTLTLPGIAGVVLTIGMAVDANVLIYERIREELAAGKSIRGAIAAGYDKAFGTIFDSNITTLICSVILIFMGTGPVKGFGVTLTIGVTVSMFTALIVTRLIFDWMLNRDLVKNLSMLHIIKGAKIDFMRLAVPAFVASWLLIVVGNGYGLFVRGKDVLGVEFSGGTQVTMTFDQSKNVGVDELRKAVAEAKIGDVLLAYQKQYGDNTRTLMLTVRATSEKEGSEASRKAIEKIQATFPDAKFSPGAARNVGPTVGAEIRATAFYAALLALFGILVYVAFRYEFSFAVGAVVAIIHDLLMTIGWYFLAGRELNATTVAALLTIIGFSINDTIVIFDRIREDLKLGIRGTFREVMNQALNQTLSRTIITSGTVFLATLSLYLFGGGPVNDFAFTFLVGILTGTYSSIYIASAIVLWWHKGQRPNIGAGQLSEVESGTATAKV